MKIDGLSNIHALQPTARTGRTAKATTGASASVAFSGSADWVRGLQSQAKTEMPPRTDVIAEMRSALADGTFESSVDVANVVEALLVEL